MNFNHLACLTTNRFSLLLVATESGNIYGFKPEGKDIRYINSNSGKEGVLSKEQFESVEITLWEKIVLGDCARSTPVTDIVVILNTEPILSKNPSIDEVRQVAHEQTNGRVTFLGEEFKARIATILK